MKKNIMKRNILLLISTVIATIATSQTPTNGLKAYYPFNNNTNDYAGTLHGVSNGTAQYATDRWGNSNFCYNVVGNSNHIILPSDNWVNGDYSVSAWVNITQTASYPRLYDFGNGYGINNVIGKLSHAGNASPSIEYYASSTSDGSNYLSNTPLIANVWYHLVYVSEGFVMKIFINNVLIGSMSGTHIPESIYRTSNKIGGSNAPLQDDTYALIDEFRLYSKALNTQEIGQLYTEGNPTGINEQSLSSSIFSIYPNPANTNLSINIDSQSTKELEKIINLKIYAIDGSLIKTETIDKSELNQHIINTSSLANGLYYLNISSGNYSQNMKFVKE